uniref:Uncharacterized protein n=2 Tax=Norrisiella sphaerica TaxID=552664 RepID=A0A7S2QTR6_9EUKA|mmetsp:Transcript_778/g.1159  ORF Transcript_778/g.1159 Transcript_778/m.1159 type:complete len:146 (+) Transcript_778:44-481(+)
MSHTNIERVLDECVRHLLAQTSHAATKSMESKAKRKIRSSRDKLSSTGTKKVDRASCDRNEAQREIKLAVISGDTGEVKSSQMGPRKLSWSVEEFLRNMEQYNVDPDFGSLEDDMMLKQPTLPTSRSLADIGKYRLKRAASAESL